MDIAKPKCHICKEEQSDDRPIYAYIAGGKRQGKQSENNDPQMGRFACGECIDKIPGSEILGTVSTKRSNVTSNNPLGNWD